MFRMRAITAVAEISARLDILVSCTKEKLVHHPQPSDCPLQIKHPRKHKPPSSSPSSSSSSSVLLLILIDLQITIILLLRVVYSSTSIIMTLSQQLIILKSSHPSILIRQRKMMTTQRRIAACPLPLGARCPGLIRPGGKTTQRGWICLSSECAFWNIKWARCSTHLGGFWDLKMDGLI